MTRLVPSVLILTLVFATAALAAEPSALVQLATASARAVHPRVTAYGTVVPDPDHLTTVALPRDGIIAQVSVRAGQLVHPGDPIVAIRTAPGAQASHQQAEAALKFAQKDLAHTRELFKQQLATRSQLASAERAEADARAQLQAQNRIGTDKTDEVLRASAHGVVTGLKASVGDRVQANTVIASIAERHHLLVNLGLEPSDALQVSPGDTVSLHSPQRGAVAFSGQIQSVDAMMDPTSRLVNAVVTIPEAVADHLVLGIALDAAIELPEKSGIAVPPGALMTDKDGTYVFVVKKGVAQRRNVRVVLENDTVALLEGKVSAGDKVVVAGNAGLEDGMRVRVH
jgi:RND family efflux transporter MFP subunit